MADEPADAPQRWTAKRRVALVVSILKGETSVAAAARKHGLTVAEVEEWRERFLLGAENALRARPRDEEALKDEQIKRLKQKIGDLVLDLDILKEATKDRPFPRRRPTSEGHGADRLGTPAVSGPRRRSRRRASRVSGRCG